MPRPRLVDRPIAKKLSLRSSVVVEIDNQLADRLTGVPRYGAWTELVEALLKKWLAGEVDIHLQPKEIDISDLLEINNEESNPQSDAHS